MTFHVYPNVIVLLMLTVEAFKTPQNINAGCHDGFSFATLADCECACSKVFTRKRCDLNDTAIIFKSLFLNDDEFQITRNQNEILQLKGPLYDVSVSNKTEFSKENYFYIFEIATVLCYPVQNSLNNCSKELLPSKDITFFDHNRTAYDNFERNYYPIDMYVKNRKGITVCKSSALQCQDGSGFESLEQCKCICFVKNDVMSRCSENQWEVIRYKSVLLNPKEYEIKWGVLNVKNLPSLKKTWYSKNQFYRSSNDSVVFCLRVHESIENCTRIRIRLSDVLFSQSDRSVYVRQYDRKYTVDLYTMYDDVIVICQDEGHLISSRLKLIGYCTSFFSLFLTFFVGLIILNRKTNFALLCYVIMLGFSSLANAIEVLVISDKNHKYLCPLLPLFEQFSFLSALFWMNIQGYVLAAAFKSCQNPKFDQNVTKKNYCIYFVCGWGLPFCISAVTFIMEEIDIPMLKPTFRKLCRFELNYAVSYIYYHGPVCISLALNLVFFVVIFVRARKLVADASNVNKDARRQLYCMVFKLIITMGFCHVTKLIHWGIRIWGSIWDYLDIVSTFQGVFILFLYTCRKNTIRRIKQSTSSSS